MKNKPSIRTNLLKSLSVNKNSGYTLIEILTALMMFGILTAAAAPNILSLNKKGSSTAEIDAEKQFRSILQRARNTAIASTSAVRITPDPVKPDHKFLVEIAQTRNCNSVTNLTQDVSSSDEIKVLSTGGFVETDKITVGGSATEILAITDSATMKLTNPVTASTGAVVELADNWSVNRRLSGDDVTLPENKGTTLPQPLAEFSADINNWTICINGRGVVYILNGNNQPQPQLTLTLTNVTNNETKDIVINQGGAITQ